MITRRDFLKLSLMGLTLSGAGCVGIVKNSVLYNIFYHLPKHVHIAKTISEYKVDGEEMMGEKRGSGIILNGKYLTMAHIIEIKPGKQLKLSEEKIKEIISKRMLDILDRGVKSVFNEYKKEEEIKGLTQQTILYGEKLEQLVLNHKNDVAIFNLPKNLKIPDFPCKPTNKIRLGEKVYVIGNPKHRGPNIREGIISDLDGYGKHPDTINCFGTSMPFIAGDSGTPIVNSNYELLGLATFQVQHTIGYVKKIKDFTKYLES